MIGMRWCGPCAIKTNEASLGKSAGQDEVIHARIAYFKERMTGKVSIENAEEPTEVIDLSPLYQAYEDDLVDLDSMENGEESIGA